MTTELDPTAQDVWDPTELQSIREGLEAAASRLAAEIQMLDSDLAKIAGPATVEALHDELDIASHRAELLQDSVQAENAAAILEQTKHVLGRLDLGLYGVCEACSGPVGRGRLEAFPRATLCMSCVR
ncbi:MAG: DnaK suppressor protein [Nocardioidaceae bacterium]|nr:DnaK suppressor protein [Nocardioidaceae bacterium]